MKKLDPGHQTLCPAGSLDGYGQQEQVCTLKIQDVKIVEAYKTASTISMENVLQYKLFSTTEPHVDPTRKPCFRGKAC